MTATTTGYNINCEFLKAYQITDQKSRLDQSKILSDSQNKEREFADLTELSHVLIQAKAKGQEKIDLTMHLDLIEKIRKTSKDTVIFSNYKIINEKELAAQLDLINNKTAQLQQGIQMNFMSLSQSLKDQTEITEASRKTLEKISDLMRRMMERIR